MKIRTDFVTNSSSSCFVMIHLDSPLIEQYVRDHSVVYDEVPYDNAEAMFSEVSTMLSGDWLVGYELPDDATLFDALNFLLTTIDPEFDETDESDESMDEFISFLKTHEKEIEQNSSGEICFVSTSEGDAPVVSGISVKEGLIRKLRVELYGTEDLEEIGDAIYEAAFPEDIDPLLLKKLFDKYGEIKP